MRRLSNLGVELKSLACLRLLIALTIFIAGFSGQGSLNLLHLWQESQHGSSFEWTTNFLTMPSQGLLYVALPIKSLVILASVLLLLGYRTRVATIFCLCSCGLAALAGVGPFWLLDGALLPLLFWSCFLPLGAMYSLDSAMNTATRLLPASVVSGATIALIIQQCLNYWLPETFFWATVVGPMSLGTAGILANVVQGIGMLGPLILFIPAKVDSYRRLLVVLFVCIHAIAIVCFKQPALLHLLAIATWSAFLPYSVWWSFTTKIDTPARRALTIYYDADCGFCKKVVHVLRTLLILPETPLLTAQSDASICKDMEANNSWVVVDWQKQRHFKFEAIAYICSLSPVFWVLAPALRLRPVMAAGTRFYEAIASNRKKAGLLTKPLKFQARSIKLSRLENWMVGLGMAIYLAIHLPLLAQNMASTING